MCVVFVQRVQNLHCVTILNSILLLYHDYDYGDYDGLVSAIVVGITDYRLH